MGVTFLDGHLGFSTVRSTNSAPRISIHRLKVKPKHRLGDDDGDAEVVGLLACSMLVDGLNTDSPLRSLRIRLSKVKGR